MSTLTAMPSTLSSLFSTYASVAATMMLLRSMASELLPHPVRSYLVFIFHYFFNLTPLAPSMITITVEESAGITRNQVFDAADVYLATKIDTSANYTRFGVYKIPKQKAITAKVEKGEEIADTYEDVKLLWRLVCEEPEKEHRSHKKRLFELRFEKKHRDMVMESYLPYVLARSKAITEEKRVIRLHTRDLPGVCDKNFGCREWGSIELEHPATFHKLAMDHDQKAMIVNDLERFVKRREYYKKVGKAWKRGYLLFGPPGTGKSSLIAAMANYLKFDIYDLELASVNSNSGLRRLLLSIANRSILVIEDIDCNAQTKSRLRKYDYDDDDDESDYDYDHEASSSSKLTLSGLLNTIDGLWSSCGDERIIIFTTNHKDRLDPALLRPGRMDVHIHMSYCTPQGLRTLASNYHDVQSHPRFDEIDGLLGGAKVTPAEIAEELMKSEDGDAALEGVFNYVKRKSDAAIESHKSKEEGGNEGGVEKKSGKKRNGRGGGNKKN